MGARIGRGVSRGPAGDSFLQSVNVKAAERAMQWSGMKHVKPGGSA